MTLAEKIIALRTEHHLSQGELAEQMGVSRQSVSKWETGASTPDLEKVIHLADLFGVTVDELVKDKANPPQVETNITPAVTAPSAAHSTQKTIAVCLLILGGIAAIVGFAFLPPLVFLSIYLLFCSVICFAVKRYAGLVIAWCSFGGLFLISPYIFGIRIFSIIALVGLIATLVLTIWVIHQAKRNHKQTTLTD